MGNPSQSYGASPAMWITHPTQVNAPRLSPARQAGMLFTYLEGWKAELTNN